MSFWETMKYKNNFVTARNVIYFLLDLGNYVLWFFTK